MIISVVFNIVQPLILTQEQLHDKLVEHGSYLPDGIN
jgi:hypothetical protein